MHQQAQNNLRVAKEAKEKLEQNITSWTESLQQEPNQPQLHRNLGSLFLQQENFERAIYHFNMALQFKPDWPEALNYLAWLKTAYEKEDFYDPDGAVNLALRACELTEYKNPVMLNILSSAYAATGKLPQAIEIVQKALDLAQSAGQLQMVSEIQGRLELYKRGQSKPDSPEPQKD